MATKYGCGCGESDASKAEFITHKASAKFAVRYGASP